MYFVFKLENEMNHIKSYWKRARVNTHYSTLINYVFFLPIVRINNDSSRNTSVTNLT